MKTNILFCGDEHIGDGIWLSCLSLVRHTTQPLHIYLLTAGIATARRTFRPLPATFTNRLEQTLQTKRPGSTVTRIDVSPLFTEHLPIANLDTRFTPLCMLRLFADLVEDIPDKILYLDTDVLCRLDCTDFYNQNIDGIDIVGVPDRYGKWFFSKPLWKRNYLNSGVLLMNMAHIRQTGLFDRCRRLCRDKRLFMPDQTALNQHAVKRCVPDRYNNQGTIRSDTVFKHFTTFFRFWPYIRSVTVKPWEPEKMHRELNVYEFDELWNDFQKEKLIYEPTNSDFLYN